MGGRGSGAKPCLPDCKCGRHRQMCLPDCNCKKHRKAENHPNWTNHPTYQAIHRRLREYRGNASDYNCVDCSKQARDWSWVHDTDDKDTNNYEPRCSSCHSIYDRQSDPALKWV